MYAVIETAGKQYRVELGTELEVDRMDAEPGTTIRLDRVLLVADGDDALIGTPIVEGASVAADVLRRDRGEKLVVFKYGPKTRRRVKNGHRQDLTVLRIADIAWGDRSAAADSAKSEAAQKKAAEAAAREAEKRAAADKALAAKLASEADSEAGTDSVASTAKSKAGAKADPGKTAKPAAKARPAAKSSASTSKSTAKAAPKTPASRTQAPAPEDGAKKRRTTKKDE